MDRNQNFFYDSVYETPEQREEKKRKQRRFFSRMFLALFIYLLCFNLIGTLIIVAAQIFLSVDAYEALAKNTAAMVLISSVSQYLLAFPIFLLITRGMDKAELKEQKKITFGEGVILFAVAELLMFIGNLIGTILNTTIGVFLNKMPENGVEEIVENTPVWLIFIVMVVLAPIVEEIIFRKVMIDRLSIYGDRAAIIFSAVAFGFMHGNLYQFFYAALLGALLGYVYTSTRNVKYTIALHAVINFFGSIVVLGVTKVGDFVRLFTENTDLIALVEDIMTSAYSTFQMGLVVAGAIALIYRHRRREIQVSAGTDIYIPMPDLIKCGVLNVGSILFILISVAFMILNLF